ncbi:hypothetical protein [Rhizobium sp. Leaf383]|uniref:hypothetical protein n=1 Tax=Rhizobium sp. Leaf383 TaxID=1736357 RepID=UPI000715EF39|nr:hypothetical protein [Rhizobium sp. Leaf383]KQS84341.1 hypothetical protein ASG58_21460 [Rhizobium sp. Leaf383]
MAKRTKAAPLKKVLVATPCYNGMVHMSYASSLIKIMMLAPGKGYEVNVFNNTDSLITRARNNAVSVFLDGDWERLFWIDSDIGFEPDQFFRVLEADREIAAGVYPLKTLYYPTQETKLAGADLAVSMLRYALNLEQDLVSIPDDGFAQVKDAATGFMCIKRSTLLKMVDAYPELKYVSDQEQLGAPASSNHYLLFDTMVENGRYLSEDYAFCRRAQRLGITIWVDLRSELTHTGPFEFRGSIPRTSQVNS